MRVEMLDWNGIGRLSGYKYDRVTECHCALLSAQYFKLFETFISVSKCWSNSRRETRPRRVMT